MLFPVRVSAVSINDDEGLQESVTEEYRAFKCTSPVALT